jgi:hypothetical protein
MSDDANSAGIGRALVTGLLLVATLGFGMAGLCGAAFTVTALPDLLSSRRAENYAAAVLVISVPTLLIAGSITWWCIRTLRRRKRDRQ